MATRLSQIRSLFRSTKLLPPGIEAISGYIVPSEDAHSSEYIAGCDCRREYISGFSGSRGCAYITDTEAALFTDGRYFLQAEEELHEGWALKKMGLKTTPSEEDWLQQALPPNSRVGVDPTLLSAPQFRKFNASLASNGSELVPIPQNLVDIVWAEARPARPTARVAVLDQQYAGATVADKIALVRVEMVMKKKSAFVVSALDEVAWLFNLRGKDIPFNPVFFAYGLVTEDEVVLYISQAKLPAEWAGSPTSALVKVKDYDGFVADLSARQFDGTVWVGPSHSQAVSNALHGCKLCEDVTPICHAKSIKNEVELEGMRACHRRDAVALCEYFLWLETELARGSHLTEVSAADRLEALRGEQTGYVSLSFPTISSSGPNGAIIHYHPHPETCRDITTDEVYLCDSGGQYLDGTTDVTRTVHFGTPTDHERKLFTLVLKGHIALSTTKFPTGTTTGLHLDSFARRALWDHGVDYRHGTGHGVGSFLNVHEGPHGISARPSAGDHPLKPGMIVTIEPGYYEDGNFGVRIENVVEVKASALFDDFNEFQPTTLFPLQAKMFDMKLLTPAEVRWVDAYHATTKAAIAPLLQEQGRTAALAWLEAETIPLAERTSLAS